jgi:hypothetical protein
MEFIKTRILGKLCICFVLCIILLNVTALTSHAEPFFKPYTYYKIRVKCSDSYVTAYPQTYNGASVYQWDGGDDGVWYDNQFFWILPEYSEDGRFEHFYRIQSTYTGLYLDVSGVNPQAKYDLQPVHQHSDNKSKTSGWTIWPDYHYYYGWVWGIQNLNSRKVLDVYGYFPQDNGAHFQQYSYYDGEADSKYEGSTQVFDILECEYYYGWTCWPVRYR